MNPPEEKEVSESFTPYVSYSLFYNNEGVDNVDVRNSAAVTVPYEGISGINNAQQLANGIQVPVPGIYAVTASGYWIAPNGRAGAASGQRQITLRLAGDALQIFGVTRVPDGIHYTIQSVSAQIRVQDVNDVIQFVVYQTSGSMLRWARGRLVVTYISSL